MHTTLNIMLLLVMALLYNMMAVMFGVEHWYFLVLAPIVVAGIGFIALSASSAVNRVYLALVPLIALPVLLTHYDQHEILGFVFSHAVIMATVLYPLYRRSLDRRAQLVLPRR